jgi:DNA mismatch repair ATPase MutS
MKAFLLYRDRDFDVDADPPPGAAALTQDLGLDTLFGAMAAGDRFLFGVARSAVLASLDEPGAILYRQQILADCIAQPAIAREIYAIAAEATESEKRAHFYFGRFPDTLLSQSIEVLQLLVASLKQLRRVADAHADGFRSEGFRRLFSTLASELDDAYLATVDDHLQRLRFRDGLLMTAQLGAGNRGTQYVLRKPRAARRSWRERIGLWDHSGYVYQIADRDESGIVALGELKGRGIALAAIALAQSMEHILSFFGLLRSEMGFYIGCLNLREALATRASPVCVPEPFPVGSAVLAGRGLYDVCLALRAEERVVGNDLGADEKALVMITGPNGGGKSTFLRGIGLAQLMMQGGMFVAAESFRADVRHGIFTHFKREEDASLRSGKLDEELSRMSSIVDSISPTSLVLFNESFASTNEREGSEIARQIIRAMLEAGIKVCAVTHMFDLAQGFYLQEAATALFLRAERMADGQRTFRLVAGEPLPTSYGQDLYRQIFDAAPDAAPVPAAGEHA